MPRHFFDLYNDKSVVFDDDGADVADNFDLSRNVPRVLVAVTQTEEGSHALGKICQYA